VSVKKVDDTIVLEMWKEKKTAQEMAEVLSVCVQNIYQSLKRQGLKPNRPPYKYRQMVGKKSKVRNQEAARKRELIIKQMYLDDVQHDEICATLRIHKSTIYKALKRMGVKTNNKRKARLKNYVRNDKGNKKNIGMTYYKELKLTMKALKVIYDNAPIENSRRDYIVSQLEHYAKQLEKLFGEKFDPMGVIYVPKFDKKSNTNEYVEKATVYDPSFGENAFLNIIGNPHYSAEN